MDTIHIRTIKMPLAVKAFTIPDANGDFNIYLNEQLPAEAQKKSLEHEKSHIFHNDFSGNFSVRTVEYLLENK